MILRKGAEAAKSTESEWIVAPSLSWLPIAQNICEGYPTIFIVRRKSFSE